MRADIAAPADTGASAALDLPYDSEQAFIELDWMRVGIQTLTPNPT